MAEEKDCINEIAERLKAPFDPKNVEWRVNNVSNKNGNKAMLVAYVQNRAIQDRLDEVFGICGWQNEYKELHDGIICGITAFIGDRKVTKWDGADKTNIEATKGGLSNSMKRAASQWGIGRYLYELDAQWVSVEQRSCNSTDIYVNAKAKNNQWITGYCKVPTLPSKALPGSNKNKHFQQSEQGLKTNHASFDFKGALKTIAKMENALSIGQNEQSHKIRYGVFNRANNYETNFRKEFTSATEEELRNYYNALSPVANVVKMAKQHNIDTDHLIRICQLVLKEEIQEVYSLFFKLNSSAHEADIISYIVEDAKNQTA
ncbi:hypothetical protein D5E69_23225 (plasmid) [Rossellomorea marisflavi]|uniref:Rad52/Rad22 family DNA repair protein n=1 Tax=Rossellomorea marisflavi TaxID=189381 RepID=UPI001316960B|nr:Rad52/Rad22 family DNA repair protein [Rossellomorea marisflavi]QHA38746.1 hypothetical protein D5E69_23225 [Rossellomorea marisflavi]